MIIPRLGKWSSLHGSIFVWKRLFLYGYKWTPFCSVSFRYLKLYGDK
jgi:hypothetical protein